MLHQDARVHYQTTLSAKKKTPDSPSVITLDSAIKSVKTSDSTITDNTSKNLTQPNIIIDKNLKFASQEDVKVTEV